MSGMSALDTPSLFERIGGSAVVDELIEAFYVRVLADPLLAPFFHDTPLDRLRKMQKEFETTVVTVTHDHRYIQQDDLVLRIQDGRIAA